MRLLLAVLPLVAFCLLLQTKLFHPPGGTAAGAGARPHPKERKWLFRVLTSMLLTLQIGKRGLDTWWGMCILVVSQLLLVEVTEFSESSLNSFSRILLPSQIGLVLATAAAAATSLDDDDDYGGYVFARTTVLAFCVRTVAALFVTPTWMEHFAQLAVLVPSVVLSQPVADEAFLTRVALMASMSALLPLALDDVTHALVGANERVFAWLLPQLELRLGQVTAVAASSSSSPGGGGAAGAATAAGGGGWSSSKWTAAAGACVAVVAVLSALLEANAMSNSSAVVGAGAGASMAPLYDLLWNALAVALVLVSVLTWGMSYATASHHHPHGASRQQPQPPPHAHQQTPPTPATPTAAASSPPASSSSSSTDQVGFLQRAQQEDLLTFQACLSFIHMLIVLFMTSIDLPHLAFVNLIIIASLLFQNHNPQSLHELVSGVVVSQSLSLFVLRYQLQDALSAARLVDPAAQLVGVDAVAEQVGLVFCSIRLVAGAILTENFSRHAAETLLLAGVSIYCCSGYSTKYLCLVMMGMSIFASRIKASTVSLAISWLNSEYELRRFMDHELRVSFAGIMLALEHCLQSEKDEARLPEDTIQMLNDALAECKRGKELCFQATMQRLAYDNSYELHIEGKTLDEGIQQNYHNVVTDFRQQPSSSDATALRFSTVHTDWNLVNHILDNAVANGSKYGTNVVMSSSIELNPDAAADSSSSAGTLAPPGFRPATLRLRVTNVPLQNERYQTLLRIKDNSELFEYTPADNEERKMGNNLWSLGGPSGGRNSSTHIGLPVAKVFANRLGGAVRLVAEPGLATFLLDVPVLLSPPEPQQLQQMQQQQPSSSSSQAVPMGSDLNLYSFLAPHYNNNNSAAQQQQQAELQPALRAQLHKQESDRSLQEEDLELLAGVVDPSSSSPGGGGELVVDVPPAPASLPTSASASSSWHMPRSHSSSADDPALVAAASMTEIPAGLVFASLDDSAMIRSTIECMLYREFKASAKSIVRGSTAEEAASFARQVVQLQADICIVDENLDYDEVAFVGTNVVKELRQLGYEGVVILYSANEKLGSKLNLELVDGFASKSASRLETKQLLAGIYWNKRAKKKFTSTLSERVFVSRDVAAGGVAGFGSSSSSSRQFVQGKHRIYIANAERADAEADAVREQDGTVIMIGIVNGGGGEVFAYSPFVRFAYARRRDVEIPALMSTKVDWKYLPLFAKFDVVCTAQQLSQCDFPMLAGLGLDGARFTATSSGRPALSQDMMRSVLVDFGPPEMQLSMLESMNLGIREGLDRINKRPTTEGVRKIAHMIKGSSVQIGARALHVCASKLEKTCMEDYTGPAEENWKLFCEFILLLLDFLQVSPSLVVQEGDGEEEE